MNYDVIRAQGSFRVCYRHNAGIYWVKNLTGDFTWSCCGWSYTGTDAGYPRKEISADRHTAIIEWKGSAHFCLVLDKIACGETNHPKVKPVFHDNNTMDIYVSIE